MNQSFSFGSYYKTESVMHSIDPRAKLFGVIIMIVAALLANSITALALLALFVLVSFFLTRIPLGAIIRSLVPLLVIAVVVTILNLFIVHSGNTLFSLGPLVISEGSLSRTVFLTTRLIIIMCAMDLVTLTTSNMDITQAAESIMSPLGRLGFPAHELSMIFGIALRFMPQFAFEFGDVYRAQLSRGARLPSAKGNRVKFFLSLMVPLFASVFRHADALSVAMEARCYHGGKGRTRLHPLKIGAIDVVYIIIVLLILVEVCLMCFVF